MYVSNYIFNSFEHLLSSTDRISHINHHHSMDNQLNCKSILKRKSLEMPAEDSPMPVINPEDPQTQSSFKNFNLKSYRQGILKKHSASFDDDSTQKPILKNRCLSCDDDESLLNFNELHSILKRKTSEQYDNSEPHGILKKREMVVHQSSDHYQPTVDEDIRPILKQKKLEYDSADENNYPRPILKKKSVDSSDDKRPILKSPRSNSPSKSANSKRLSVAQRISNLESIMHDPNAYKKPVKENSRSSRDRSRFHTQPVTPSEIKAIKKYVAHYDFKVTNHSVRVCNTYNVLCACVLCTVYMICVSVYSYYVIIIYSRTTRTENLPLNVSTPNHATDKLATDVVAEINNRDTSACAALTRTISVSAKTKEFQSICDKASNTSISDVNSNITGIYLIILLIILPLCLIFLSSEFISDYLFSLLCKNHNNNRCNEPVR